MFHSQAFSYFTYPAFSIVHHSFLLELTFCSFGFSDLHLTLLALQGTIHTSYSKQYSIQKRKSLKSFPPNSGTK
jgi:hypothetical protein